MSLLIDTHSHLYAPKFQSDMDEVLKRAREVLSHIFLPNIDLESIPAMHDLADRDPDFLRPMMGLHPCYVKEDYRKVLDEIRPWFEKRTYYGVGETGLDYYWDKTFVKEQKDSLRVHIQWAKEMKLPLILHCRESMEDVIELVEEGQDGRLFGIFHCFDGSLDQAQKVADLNFKVGIGGPLTYKRNEELREVFRALDLRHVVLETDSPYLPPVPYRGKRNESSYLQHVAAQLASVKETSPGKIAEATSANARELFGV